MKKQAFIIIGCLLCVIYGKDTLRVQRVLEPPFKVDMKPPVEANRQSSRNDVITDRITMPIDHFNPHNNDTFQMRYMYNEEFFGGPGYPVFIMVGGEWTILEGWLRTGTMYEMAVEHHGYMIYTEHRYYGETLPYSDFTAENLRYLNVDQALADLAYYIHALKKQSRFADSEVILYGGSYAANMVLWFKQRYPHLVRGVVASSGPIKAKANFHEYLEVVHNAYLSEGGEECVDTIRLGIEGVVNSLDTEQGRLMVQDSLRMCNPVSIDDKYDMAYLAAIFTWTLSGTVQSARPGTIRNICLNFASNIFGSTPFEKITGFIRNYYGLENNCWVIDYATFLSAYYGSTESRAWFYQTCTEYGFYQIVPTSGTMFDSLHWHDLDFYVETCKRIFDERFDEDFLYKAVDRVNQIFGGLQPNVNNTVNVHGAIDPWHALGVYDTDLKETSPTYMVPRASHCFDMRSWDATDTLLMSQTKATIKIHVRNWLAN